MGFHRAYTSSEGKKGWTGFIPPGPCPLSQGTLSPPQIEGGPPLATELIPSLWETERRRDWVFSCMYLRRGQYY